MAESVANRLDSHHRCDKFAFINLLAFFTNKHLSQSEFGSRIHLTVLLAILIFVLGGCRDQHVHNTDPEHPSAQPPINLGSKKLTDTLGVSGTDTPRKADPGDWFDDATRQTTVDFTFRSGRESGQFTMLEMFGGGVGLFDFDCDGDIDIFFPAGGTISSNTEVSGNPVALFRNDGGWKFTDVTVGSGLDVAIDYSHGCTVGDVNRDGFPDLWISCFGKSRLFLNAEGGKFVDVTESAGVGFEGWSTGAAFADIDRDGWPDLYVTNYLRWKPDKNERCRDPHSGQRDVCMPGSFTGGPDRLFLNLKNGKFAEISREAGLHSEGRGLAVVAADFNLDGWVDFYVANDVMRNYLYLGQGNRTFEEQAVVSGVAGNEYGVPEGSMGADVADFDGDGLADLFVTNYELEENSLYRNDGMGTFSHCTVSTGLAGKCRPYVGWGTGFADFDSDGWMDLVIANGHVVYHNRQSSFRQPSFVYRNVGGKRFADVSAQASPWFSVSHNARGIAIGDLDNDGAPDMVISQWDEPAIILRNRKPPSNWVSVELRGDHGDVNAIGSRVQIKFDNQKISRFVRGGGGYASYFDPRIVIAVPGTETTSVNVTVRWPDGHEELFREIPTRQLNRLIENRGHVILESGDSRDSE